MEHLPVRRAEEAAFIYHIVLHELLHQFRPSDIPDFRYQGDAIRSIVVPGVLVREHKRPAWLKILLSLNASREIDIMRRFNALASKSVRAPRIKIRGETTSGFSFFVTEDVGNERFIPETRYGTGNPHTSWSNKHDIADAFWAVTAANLSVDLRGSKGPAAEIWFDDKTTQWLQRAEMNGAIEKRFLSPKTISDAIETLRAASENMPAPGTYFSHAHFSNTEVRKRDDRIYLIDWGSAKFVPLLYDAAFWVWNAALYSWRIDTRAWLRDVEDYEDAFCSRGRHLAGYAYEEDVLRHAFRTCLLERMLGALLVDCAEGSPAGRSLTEQQQIVRNCRMTLKALLGSF